MEDYPMEDYRPLGSRPIVPCISQPGVHHAADRVASDDQVADPTTKLLLALEGEDHTFGNVLREIMWLHPHVELASYTKEHPTASEILVRCQTNGIVTAEQGMVESLYLAKDVLSQMEDTMTEAVARFERLQAEHRIETEDQQQ